jgi:hypothetical protein
MSRANEFGKVCAPRKKTEIGVKWHMLKKLATALVIVIALTFAGSSSVTVSASRTSAQAPFSIDVTTGEGSPEFNVSEDTDEHVPPEIRIYTPAGTVCLITGNCSDVGR